MRDLSAKEPPASAQPPVVFALANFVLNSGGVMIPRGNQMRLIFQKSHFRFFLLVSNG